VGTWNSVEGGLDVSCGLLLTWRFEDAKSMDGVVVGLWFEIK
jgi:hypothetical protein